MNEEERVELVAEAIHNARFARDGVPPYPWENEDGNGQYYCRRLARAAIASLQGVNTLSEAADAWNPGNEDPYWMLEVRQEFDNAGAWLKNDRTCSVTRDPVKALRFPSRFEAECARSQLPMSESHRFEPTEHAWVGAEGIAAMRAAAPTAPVQDDDELGDGSDFGVTGEWWGSAQDDDAKRTFAELQHWFFQKLASEQREMFLVACGFPKGLSLSIQMQALRSVANRLSADHTGVLIERIAGEIESLETLDQGEWAGGYSAGITDAARIVRASPDVSREPGGEPRG